ncbi:pyridoxal-phosphate-dependent aminotransferase family protein [Pararhodobacter aggregans]|uniref:Serine--glyoxylate aminotransferase n=1 Tax=Pararhodobacter aggregans TaxID=404875 RepID=A0A2T7ULT3_9RHOB|nr:aminotransferase class V-fold PLP-dependent enzyme [Pararhodobacter aggregans]PTW99050.1 alanine-glyoxylate transaminase/serine-glyoxylate transaminase/serine-pyruvate transaminase [Pararhodobacter aggregans]PVE45609.1 serine--glyoxylate aminotransferase [Pararhodobacter aggregans]
MTGRHHLFIPGPSALPDDVMRAMDRPTIDHRGPAFQALAHDVQDGLRWIFGCAGPVVTYPASGSGAWEAALVNTLSPGDQVLMYESGQFASLWAEIAGRLSLKAEILPGDWRRGAEAQRIEDRLRADPGHRIRAVCVVHNETSTGCTADIPAIRAALDAAGHPALLMVDTISSLGSIPYRADDWGVDVTVGGSQKGLMLPPGISFNALGPKALEAAKTATLPRSYWAWEPVIRLNADGFFPYTPATNTLFGLRAALAMMRAEGLEAIFARHRRLARATRAAATAWGLELQCAVPSEYSAALTALRVPEGASADRLRQVALASFDLSLGNGLGKLADRVFRIGHLGHLNDLSLISALAGVEMSLGLADIAHQRGGVAAAMGVMAEAQRQGEPA